MFVNIKLLAIGVISILALLSCQGKEKPIEKDMDFGKTISYSMGYEYILSTQQDSLPFDIDYFLQGVSDARNGEESLYSEKEIDVVKKRFSEVMQLRSDAKTLQTKKIFDSLGIVFKTLSPKFLEENSKREGVTVTKTGLQYEILKEGSGEKVKITDLVKINLKGWLPNGNQFEDTEKMGQLMEYPVAQMFPGFTEAFLMMRKGSHFIIHMPDSLAFREFGSKPVIPPNSALKWEIEMVEIIDLSMPGGMLPEFNQ